LVTKYHKINRVTWQNLGLPHMHASQSRGSRFTDFSKPTKI